MAVQVFDVFRDNEVSVDVVATSEISVSLTLDPRYVRPHTSQNGVLMDFSGVLIVSVGTLQPHLA